LAGCCAILGSLVVHCGNFRGRLALGPYVPVKREPVKTQVQCTKASSALLRLRQVALATKDFVHPCPDRERVSALRRGNPRGNSSSINAVRRARRSFR
jgi:hypothetical protein